MVRFTVMSYMSKWRLGYFFFFSFGLVNIDGQHIPSLTARTNDFDACPGTQNIWFKSSSSSSSSSWVGRKNNVRRAWPTPKGKE
jgi:hypothetical protein